MLCAEAPHSKAFGRDCNIRVPSGRPHESNRSAGGDLPLEGKSAPLAARPDKLRKERIRGITYRGLNKPDFFAPMKHAFSTSLSTGFSNFR